MKWIKKGVIFTPDGSRDWMASHASVPVVDEELDGVLRIYFGTRDGNGRSHTSYIKVDAACPATILYVHDKPILPLGRPGTFDDSGIMPSWMVNHRNKKYLYYIGWNQQVTVPYRLAIGLAVSDDGGESFHKVSEGPVCDRCVNEPYFNTAPCVLWENDIWRMWYVSCTGWEVVDERMEPRYHIKYADSTDGISWQRTGRVCIDYDRKTDAVGRPCVYKVGADYKMLYSYRGLRGYRNDAAHSYRLGYAHSNDGLTWTRWDEHVGIERSNSAWDSEMIEYCYVREQRGNHYLFYNGNGFGASGFGYAVQSAV